MTFTNPIGLILLVAIPLAMYLGWPRFRYRRWRDTASLLLRGVIILLLVLVVAGVQIVRSSNRLAVVFLVDASDSVGQTGRDAELQYVRDALGQMSPDDLAGVILFGDNALVERPMNGVRELGPVHSTPLTTNSNLAAAIRIGLGMFPAGTARRLVVLSDGQQTEGDAQSAAELAAATGVQVDYVPFTRAPGPELLVSDVRVPDVVNAGQQFDLSMTIHSDQATQAVITVLAGGQVIHREQQNLQEGDNSYSLPLQAGQSGFRDFQVQVDPLEGDTFYQNNQLSAFSRVVGPPRVLLVRTSDEESSYLQAALTQTGLQVDVVGPNELPIGVAALAQYDSVILDDVPASDLSGRMEILQSYVRDLGGGLVAVGGPNAYAPGGYFETPLEETLPVDMQIKDQQRIPQLTIVYVIDRSGSMGIVGPSGVENIDLAKEAIIRSIDFLQPTDRAGIVSFDTDGAWIAQIQPVQDRLGLQSLVGTLRAGGGTDIMAGYRQAGEAIAADPSQRKHIILLTDGGANPAGLVELSGKLYDQYNVTTSVVAIGAGAAQFLEDMATAGHGQYHATDTVESIPTIFTQETVFATRSYILENPFTPTLSAASPIMNGITSSPQLLGYVATTPKQTAQVILTGPGPFHDPILAAWQYGLGRAVAFTSDATARWATQWVTWDQFAQFWSQTVRWTITEGANTNVETRVEMDGAQARLVVDARDSAGNFLNGLNLQASLLDPNLTPMQVQLHQVAPGRYEATFTPSAEGAYFLRITGGQAGDNPVSISETTGWVMSYSPEYNPRQQGVDTNLLSNIASLTGGRSLQDDPGAAFAHNLSAENATVPLWPWLLLAALLLLPFDIAVRRLIVTQSDIVRLRRWVREAIFGPTLVADGPSQRLSTLMGAKARAQERTRRETPEQTGQSAPESGNPVAALRSRREHRRADNPHPLEEVAPPITAKRVEAEKPNFTPSAPEAAPPVSAPPADDEGNIAGRLLEKRKRRER